MRATRALVAHAQAALSRILRFDAPADQLLSRYFRDHRNLGQNDRAFVAETVFAILRRKRSLEAAARSSEPAALVAAALEPVVAEEFPPAVRADMPDWLWQRLVQQYGEDEAQRLAQGLLNPAPLDLRVNLARIDRDAAR